MHARLTWMLVPVILWTVPDAAGGQPYGEPDRGRPGDEMIQAYLARETDAIHGDVAAGAKSRDDWEQARAIYREEYLYMLGLWPVPAKTPLKATVTGTLRGRGFVVDMLHYQSRPRLYVTANLYRPADAGKPPQYAWPSGSSEEPSAPASLGAVS